MLPSSRILLGLAVLATACKDDKGDTGVDSEVLGSFTTNSDELTGPIEFEVPSGAGSVLFWCGEYGDDKLGTAWEIKAPDGSLYYVNEYYEPYSSTQMRVGNHDGFLPVLFPVSPDHDLTPGTWSVDVWIASSSPVTTDCGLVTDEARGSSATIDLHLVFVGLDDLDAASAPDDADLQAVLDRVSTTWSAIGLSVGDVTYEDFAGDTEKYAVIDISDDDSGEMNALFRTADPPSNQSLTIFFVQEISSSGSTVYGLAAGPPGTATLPGTSKSGMVVGTVDLRDAADFIGLVTAHEGLHFLGLFHTSEKSGEQHDPISDTPECDSSADADGNGRVDQDECAGKGGDNVMFWNPPDDATELTGDQGWVARRNPATR